MLNLKFCPKCGKKTFKFKNHVVLNCQSCDFNWFVNPKPTVNILFLDSNNQVLLIKRKFEPKKNLWGMVGGFVDINETLEQAILREIKEEVGLQIFADRLLYIDSKIDKYEFEGLEYDTLSAIFSTVLTASEIQNLQPNDDVLEFKFFEKRKIPYSKIAFESTKKILQKYFVQESQTNEINKIDQIRQKIDQTDKQILINLKYRKLLEKLVAEYKKLNNLEPLQTQRWKIIQNNLKNLAIEYNLSQDLVQKLWETIHADSVNSQKNFLEKI